MVASGVAEPLFTGFPVTCQSAKPPSDPEGHSHAPTTPYFFLNARNGPPASRARGLPGGGRLPGDGRPRAAGRGRPCRGAGRGGSQGRLRGPWFHGSARFRQLLTPGEATPAPGASVGRGGGSPEQPGSGAGRGLCFVINYFALTSDRRRWGVGLNLLNACYRPSKGLL